MAFSFGKLILYLSLKRLILLPIYQFPQDCLDPSHAIHSLSFLLGGLWRSLVAHVHGVHGVAGSNPVSPTTIRTTGKPLK